MAARQAPVRYMENPPKLSFLIDQERPPRDALRPAAVRRDQKIFAALSSVCQTPHPSGTPTNSQNRAALRSRPPLPMPNEPCWTAAALLALAAWSFATSASLIYHFELTGLIRKLQINPATSIAHKTYIVLS